MPPFKRNIGEDCCGAVSNSVRILSFDIFTSSFYVYVVKCKATDERGTIYNLVLVYGCSRSTCDYSKRSSEQ